jgi:hypothetical protein
MKTVNIHEAKTHLSRLGFLAGAFSVPEDFDRMGAEAVAALFEGADPAR